MQTANLPGITVAESTVTTPARAYPVTGTIIEFETLDITFIIDEDMKNFMEIFQWLRAMSSTEDLGEERERLQSIFGNTSLYSDATLTILTNNMNASKSVTFRDIFPTSLSSIAFESSVDAIEVITSDVSFQLRDYVIGDVI